MNKRMKCMSWTLAWTCLLTSWADGTATSAENVVTLVRHETVARFDGTRHHRCMGMTALCPDRCGHSGQMANFSVLRYWNYEKLGEYGEPKSDRFDILLVDSLKNEKVDRPTLDAVAALKKGDVVLLSWNHEYVTVDGSSSPRRRIVKLEPLAPPGTEAWMKQLDFIVGTRDALDHGPDVGSEEWMVAVSRKLGVYDAHGAGPDLETEEWRNAVQWKAFGVKTGELATDKE